MAKLNNERAHTRLTIAQILEAFPEEAKELVPRELRRINKELIPDLKRARAIFNEAVQYFTTEYALELGRASMPKKKIEHKKTLEAMKSIMSGKNSNMNITEDQLEIARSVPIRELFDFRNPRVIGGRFNACCPMHAGGQEKTPSFFIMSQNRFKCFGCSWSGDSIEFVIKTKGLDFVNAVKYLVKM